MASAVGDIFQIAAVGSAFGQRIMLTHWYRLISINPGINEGLTRNSLTNAMRSGVGGGDVLESSYLALLPPQYSLLYWRGQMISPFRKAFVDITSVQVGAHAAAARTANQAAAITLRTEDAGRKQVSTKHIGPIPEGATVQVAGEFDAAYLNLLSNLLSDLTSNVLDATIGAEWEPVIFHGPGAEAYDKLVDGQAQETVRVMRRRTVRVGE